MLGDGAVIWNHTLIQFKSVRVEINANKRTECYIKAKKNDASFQITRFISVIADFMSRPVTKDRTDFGQKLSRR